MMFEVGLKARRLIFENEHVERWQSLKLKEVEEV